MPTTYMVKKTGRKMKIDLNFMQIFATSLVKAVSS